MAKSKKKKVTQGVAIAALILNTFLLPGLGTLVAGKTKEGTIQLVLFLIGIPLAFILIGIPLMFAMWIWALVTGIKLVQESA